MVRILILALFAHQSFANVATLTFVRGDVKINGAAAIKGQKIEEGHSIETQKRSIAKLEFIDKSKMTVGPNSNVQVTAFKEGKAGLITLLKGKIRSQVEKDGSKDKDKLYVKTPTAAMGVRGTDFQMSYNPDSKKSAVLTFEGQVAFRQINNSAERAGNNLGNFLQTSGSVRVNPGQFSGTDPKLGKTTIPTRISPVQYSKLKQNTEFKEATAKKKETTRSHLPQGFAASIFTNDNSALKEDIVEQAGAEALTVESTQEDLVNAPPPEGSFNAETNEFAPPAGGYMSENGDYIAPVPGQSHFDPIAGVYVPNTNFGGVDPATGNYVPPAGFKLNSMGKFVKATAQGDRDRVPSSPDGVEGPKMMEAGAIGDFNSAMGGDFGGNINDPAFDAEFAQFAQLLEDAEADRDDDLLEANQDADDITTRLNITVNIL